MPKQLVIAVVAAFSLALGVAAAPARAQALSGYTGPDNQPKYFVGTVFHPRYGNLVCLYFPVTGYAYFPALGDGYFVPGAAGGTYRLEPMGSHHLGPYATIRRANEVAAYYRSLGHSTSTPYHNGNGYYVDVR